MRLVAEGLPWARRVWPGAVRNFELAQAVQKSQLAQMYS